MSNTLMEIETEYSKQDMGQGLSQRMSVTAFVGRNWGRSIQITLENEYFCMTQKQVKNLISVLEKRLACKKGYSATDTFDGDLKDGKRHRRK